MSNVTHTGGCHCGAVRFQFEGSSKPTVCICNCSICEKKQIKSVTIPDDQFQLLKGGDGLTEYLFNTREAKHYFCKTCGVQSFYKPRSNPGCTSVMVYCIDSGTLDGITESFFDGQNWEESIKKCQPKTN